MNGMLAVHGNASTGSLQGAPHRQLYHCQGYTRICNTPMRKLKLACSLCPYVCWRYFCRENKALRSQLPLLQARWIRTLQVPLGGHRGHGRRSLHPNKRAFALGNSRICYIGCIPSRRGLGSANPPGSMRSSARDMAGSTVVQIN